MQVARYEIGATRRLRALRMLLPTNVELPTVLPETEALEDVPVSMSYETIAALARDRQELLSAVSRCV